MREKKHKPWYADLLIMLLLFTGLLMFSSCGGDDATGPQGHQVERIVISPDSVAILPGEEVEFSAFALTVAGDTVDTADLDIEWEWWSTDPDIFTVESGGLATARDTGEAFCVIEATIFEGSLNFTGRDSAFVMVF